MRKTFKYRILPSKSQESNLLRTLSECRWLWNYALYQRKTSWENNQETLSKYSQDKGLTVLKTERPALKEVHSQVLQNVHERLDLAFKSFFRRVKRNENPGYPRFRNQDRYNSFCYPQSGWKLSNDKVFLSKIGHVRVVLHRPVEGCIKRCTIKRSPTGKWFVSFSCEVNQQAPVVPIQKAIGVDVGIKSFAALSNGQKIGNPKFLRRDLKALAKAQKKHSGNRSKKNRKVICRVHERIKNRREDFSHQVSRRLIDSYDFIAVEDLDINSLKENSFRVLSREISDASWSTFLEKLTYKAEWAGKVVQKVNPAYTSQNCSNCGSVVPKELSDRWHNCLDCGLSLDRDVNAALNILALGTQSLEISIS